jgi:quinol monooxygenase YgiN
MIMVTLHFNVDLDRKGEIVKLFSLYAGPVSVQTGCLAVRLYAHYKYPGDFVLVEEWISRKSFQKHLRSHDFQNVLDIIDLSKEPPEIKFHTVSSIEGFEIVEKLRKKLPRFILD